LKAVILAAGSLKKAYPVCITKIGNKTLIEYLVEKLKRIGINEIGLVIGPEGEKIKEVLGDSVKYFLQEKPLGTAHAILCARNFITESNFLVLNSDILFSDDLSNFSKLKMPTIAAYWVDDTSKYGKLWAKSDKLVEIKEKVPEFTSGLINAGIYLFPKDVFELIKKTPLSPRGQYEITDTIKMLIDRGFEFNIHKLNGYWRDIATAPSSEISKFFMKKI